MSDNYRGSQVRRDKVLANFRNPDYRRFPKQRNWRADRDGMSADHLALIRKLPCTCCPSTREIEAHHLKSGDARLHRALTLKAPDMYALPLCKWACHNSVEAIGSRREEEWFAQYGINPYELSSSLWKARGNLENMQRIMAAHKALAKQKRKGV